MTITRVATLTAACLLQAIGQMHARASDSTAYRRAQFERAARAQQDSVTRAALTPTTKHDPTAGHYVTVKGQPACESSVMLSVLMLWVKMGNVEESEKMVRSGAGNIQYENAEQSPCFYFRAGRPVVILGRDQDRGEAVVRFRFTGPDTSTYYTKPEFLIAP
jgi:hypothetical protein